MSLDAGRVGVRPDQVDVHGRVISHSFLNDLIESLPEWTDMPVWVNGTEEILPSNSSVPVTSPILADIQYPDVRRNDQYFTYRESPTTVDGLAKLKRIKGNTLVFNQSTLLPFKGTGIKTVGFNQWDEEYEDGVYRVYNASGDGSKQSISGYTRCKNLVRILPNQRYYLKKGNRTIDGYVAFYDASGNYLGFDSVISYSLVSAEYIVFTSPSNANFCTFYSQGSIEGTCLNIYDEELNGTYEPYTSSTTDLPTLTYFPNGMKSAGNVYDELLPTKAITRVGMVDLGSLNWTASASGVSGKYRMISDTAPSGIKIPPNNDTVSNAQSAKYTAITPNSAYNAVNGLAIATNGRIIVYDDAYNTSSSASAFKSAMSGVYLYYELATPIELPTLSLGD